MALTVLPTSGLPHDPVWDDSIVPALRKRLEHESHALSKRMSAASIISTNDEYSLDTFASNAAYLQDRTATPTSQNQKPSAIPRPSLQHTMTAEFSPNGSASSSQPGTTTRSRTFSQPHPFDFPLTNGISHSSSIGIARSTSPMSTTMKSTRIPVSRARTGSTASARPRVDSRAGSYRPNGHAYQPPIVAALSASRTQGIYEEDFAPNRMSSDSEERPFEHWYRGDVSRNGGVGELRIGRKQEMLDIANYGHTLRQEQAGNSFSSSSRSRSNSRGHDGPLPQLNRRPRSGSVGDPGRASIYIDDQQISDGSMVLDERPLTDLDTDEDQYGEEVEGDYMDEDISAQMGYDRENASPLSADRSDTPTTLVDVSKSSFKSRLPTPSSRQVYEPQELPTPSQSPTLNLADASPPPAKGGVSTKSATPTPTVTPKPSPKGVSTAKRRAKSPAASTHGKKPRTKSPPKTIPKKARENEDRRSVAQYPTPEGDDMAHAIPSWTQPVPSNGNWDDVVLPVVARKKGLEGQYEQVDGSPRPKIKDNVVEPAPGTFGYDHTKYRPPRGGTVPESIPMDEFGQRRNTGDIISQEPTRSPLPSPLPDANPLLPNASRIESPLPFSQYGADVDTVPQIRVTRPSNEAPKTEITVEEDPAPGCCKCLIM